MPKTPEHQARIAESQVKKKEKLASEQAEYDSLTPGEQVDYDLAKADKTDKQMRKDLKIESHPLVPKIKLPEEGIMGKGLRRAYYNAGVIDAQGNTREGIIDPRQMLAMNRQNRLATNPQGSGLMMASFPFL